MARNRRKQSAAVRFGGLVKAFLLCVFMGLAGLGYVWQKQQIHELGKDISQRETQLMQLQKKNRHLSRSLAVLQSHKDLDARVRAMNLGLEAPMPHQVVRVRQMGISEEQDEEMAEPVGGGLRPGERDPMMAVRQH